MAQVDPVALRLRDLVYENILSHYNSDICKKAISITPNERLPIIRFYTPQNRSFCSILFYNNRMLVEYNGDYVLQNTDLLRLLNFQPHWTEDVIVRSCESVILRKVRYPSRANAKYSPEQPGTHCANPDLAAVFLALRARIERLRARLQ